MTELNSPLPPSAIRWQQVVELDPAMAEPDRNKLVTALESLERTTIGQVKLQEMVAVTEHLKKYRSEERRVGKEC